MNKTTIKFNKKPGTGTRYHVALGKPVYDRENNKKAPNYRGSSIQFDINGYLMSLIQLFFF
jgi:hypothetical protein